MRILRYLFAIVLVSGLTGIAKADTDFHMVVLDPPPGYTVYTINDLSTFDVSFTPCVSPGQIPTGAPYEGCFTFQNETPYILDSLTIDVSASIPNQTAGCAASGLTDPTTGDPLDIFSNPMCGGLAQGGYLLTFTGGTIGLGQIVTIAEDGVDPADFPATTATLGAETPEPSSVFLLSTGLLFMGYLFAERRKPAFLTSRR
jgi:hypothetical protein